MKSRSDSAPAKSVKAISVRQPWAHAIVHLGKSVENRTWAPTFRGRLLIHASAGIGSRRQFNDDIEALVRLLGSAAAWTAFRDGFLACVSVRGDLLYVPAPSLRLGGIVGVATLDHVIDPAGLGETEADRRWHSPSQFGLVLRDVRPTPFAPCKGALGIFDLDPPDGIEGHAERPSARPLGRVPSTDPGGCLTAPV